jgi:hypothetical protein
MSKADSGRGDLARKPVWARPKKAAILVGALDARESAWAGVAHFAAESAGSQGPLEAESP